MKEVLFSLIMLCMVSSVNAQERLNNWQDSIASLIVNYMGSETWEDALLYVMEPERVKPLMEDYYKGTGFVCLQRSIDEIKHDYGFCKIKGINHILYKCKDLWVVKTANGYKIDWEASVNYNPVNQSSILLFPNRTYEVRTVVSLNVYTYEMADNGNWIQYKGFGKELFVKKNSSINKKLFDYLYDNDGRGMILKIKRVTFDAPDYDSSNPKNRRETDKYTYYTIIDVVSNNLSKF